MKIPKTFVKENISEKDIERILNLKEKDKIYNRHIDRLFSSCDQFLDSASGSLEVKYNLGEKIANKYLYTLEDIENLSIRILLGHPWGYAENLGFYFSALINKIIGKNDTITLTPGMEFDGVGTYLAKGNIIVDGDAGSFVGALMIGGKITILGDTEDYMAYEMKNGVIIVSGSVGGTVGYQAQGGELYVNDVGSMIARSCMANVYKNGKKIWPNDSSKSRGWLF